MFRILFALLLCASTMAAAPWVERDFPFFSSVLDARKLEPNNLTPRALILNVASNTWVAFDIDLLRVAAVWQGPGVTPVSMAQVSHYTPGKKAPEGQKDLPQIDGIPILLNGLYPGIQATARPVFADPRPPGDDSREIGRGPLTNSNFKAIQVTAAGIQLEYEISGISVEDVFSVTNATLMRSLRIGARLDPVTVIVNRGSLFDLSPSPFPTLHTIPIQLPQAAQQNPARDWSEAFETKVERVSTNDAFRIEHLSLPAGARNVRLADVAFFSDGRAAGVMFDGDVWLIDGLETSGPKWRRLTSGLHEPLTLAIRNDEIFVFDRNGVWRVREGRHELFCNRFTQTAETREYANSMRVAPDGSFIIAKGGQTGTSIGRDNGSVLRISADGKAVTTLATGFRQPFLGVQPSTGMITVTDQQGHYIPTTPIHVLGSAKYHGFRSTILPKEEKPPEIAEPLLWIPHAINASALNQVWLSDKGMGPLNNSLIHVGYYRSEIFSVLWDGSSTDAGIVSVTRDFDFTPLSAAVHPKTGHLYVAGFQIWGGSAPKEAGLARISHIGGPTLLPLAVRPYKEGVLLKFDQPVDEALVRRQSFSAERWNYQRSANYGSPHFKLDGSKGQDAMFASSAYLSLDGKSVFVGFADMRPVMQMRVGWSLRSESGKEMQNNAYLTPRALQKFDPTAHGFEVREIDLTPVGELARGPEEPITADEGRKLVELMGCVACHSNDGTTLGKVGPSWKGVFRSKRPLANGSAAIADREYLRESIRQPAAKIVKDFDKSDTGMPSYEGILSDAQIESIILYLQSL